jgi:hypothetical protein
MKSISLLNIAASIAVSTVLLVVFILVPEPLWTAITIATAISFAGSVGYVFYVPSIFRQNAQTTDASQIAAVGMLGTVSIVLLMATGGGFVLALVGYQKLGLALLVFGIGAFLVMSLVLNAALKVVGEVSAKWSQPSHHVNWQIQVNVLVSLSTNQESIAKFRTLLEKLRFSASDVPGGSPQDAGIEEIFNVMSEKLQSDPTTDLTSHFGGVNSLLVQRDVYLRSARSKA